MLLEALKIQAGDDNHLYNSESAVNSPGLKGSGSYAALAKPSKFVTAGFELNKPILEESRAKLVEFVAQIDESAAVQAHFSDAF